MFRFGAQLLDGRFARAGPRRIHSNTTLPTLVKQQAIENFTRTSHSARRRRNGLVPALPRRHLGQREHSPLGRWPATSVPFPDAIELAGDQATKLRVADTEISERNRIDGNTIDDYLSSDSDSRTVFTTSNNPAGSNYLVDHRSLIPPFTATVQLGLRVLVPNRYEPVHHTLLAFCPDDTQ